MVEDRTSTTDRRLLPRTRTLVVMLVVQVAAMYCVPLALGLGEASLRTLFDADYALWMGSFTLGACLLQAGLILPALPVRTKRADGRPGWLRVWASSAALGVPSATVLAWAAILALGENSLGGNLWIYVWCGAAAVLTLIAHRVLRRTWTEGLSVRASLIAAGFIAGMLVGGLVGLGFGIIKLSANWEPKGDWTLLNSVAACALVGWIAWTPILIAFARKRHHEDALSRIASRLFAGSAIEFVAIVPFEAMMRRKSSCYCDEGTFFALLATVTAGLITMGPAILLLPIGRRRRRLQHGSCLGCGYDLSGVGRDAVCPECGRVRIAQQP